MHIYSVFLVVEGFVLGEGLQLVIIVGSAYIPVIPVLHVGRSTHIRFVSPISPYTFKLNMSHPIKYIYSSHITNLSQVARINMERKIAENTHTDETLVFRMVQPRGVQASNQSQAHPEPSPNVPTSA